MPDEQAELVLIGGFGLPGRSLVDRLARKGIDYLVIELNGLTVERASAGGIKIIKGDVSDLETLRKAGAVRATLMALMVPSDEVVLRAISHVRQLNPAVPIIARCAFTSTGLEASRRGANATIVAEQVVARELDQMAKRWIAD